MRAGPALRLTLAVALAVGPAAALAHGVAGQRFFPTTFAVDDPFIQDELSLLLHSFQTNEGVRGATARSTSFGVGYSKRILPDVGVEIDEEYQLLHTAGDGTSTGFSNLQATLKYQFLTSDAHETILALGVSDEIGGTGSSAAGAAPFSTISPAFYFGKGLGDLPASLALLRPLAITGVAGPNLPTQRVTDGSANPTTLTWAFTVQYSLMYLQSAVKDIGLGQPFNRMVAILELPMTTCLDAGCAGRTTGTVNPGVVWIGRHMELGVAAEIPVNAAPGADIGLFVLLHLFVDDLFPGSIGRPVFQ